MNAMTDFVTNASRILSKLNKSEYLAPVPAVGIRSFSSFSSDCTNDCDYDYDCNCQCDCDCNCDCACDCH